MSRAYMCIKAISKKKPELVRPFREEFTANPVVGKVEADRIFTLIEPFARYAFNKSHATSYAQTAYFTAWFKAHYPTEFMASILSSEMNGSEREKYFVGHIGDARSMGIGFSRPDMNLSEVGFRPDMAQKEGGRVIRMGLGAAKGIGADKVAAIVAERKRGGEYRSLHDLFHRVAVEGAQVKALIHAGAFDTFGERGRLLAAIPLLARGSKKVARDVRRGQMLLFGGDEGAEMPLPMADPLPIAEKLAAEFEVLSFYLSGHPLDAYRDILRLARHKIGRLGAVSGTATVVGMVTGFSTKEIKRSRAGNTTMARFTLEDMTGSVDCIMWPDFYAPLKGVLGDGWVCVGRGKVDTSRTRLQLIMETLTAAEKSHEMLSPGLLIEIREDVGPGQMERLGVLLRSNPGRMTVFFRRDGVTVRAGLGYKLRYHEGVIEDIDAIVGPGSARLLGSEARISRAN